MNDIDQTLENTLPKQPTQRDIPEAVASVTYSITSKDGFPALFTVRAISGNDLLIKMSAIEPELIKRGYKPQEKGYKPYKKDVLYVDGQFCPDCGGRLVEGQAKNGKKFWKCEHQKYDYTTKSVQGCQYINWK